MTLGDIMRAYRRQFGLTLDKANEYSQVSRTQWFHIEKGKDGRGKDFETNDFTTYQRVANAMGISATALVALTQCDNDDLLSDYAEMIKRCKAIEEFVAYILSKKVDAS